MKTGTLIGYYVKSQEARETFRRLRRKGYHRIVWVNRDTDGDIHIGDPFPRRRILGAAVAFILLGAFATRVLLRFHWSGLMFTRLPSALIPAAGFGALGILLSMVWIRRSKFGIERKLLEDHARWLVPGETVLILRTSIERLRIPVTVVLESGETPPAVFVLHPQRESPALGQEDQRLGETPVSATQIQEHARRLATDHRLDSKPLRNIGLLRRLEESRRWVQQVCLDLTEASHLQQSVPPAAQWLLDNEYILESSVRDVRLNLPSARLLLGSRK